MAIKDTLKSKREEAIKIVKEIEQQSLIIENNVRLSKTLLSSIENNSNEAKKLNTSLNRIIKTTNEAIVKFKNEKDNISRLLKQVNNFYSKKYLPLVSKIEDNETGFKARIKQGTTFKNEINKIAELSKKQYDEVKKYASELKKGYREIKSIDNSIRKLFDNSTKNNYEINEINKHVSKLETQIITLKTNLDNIYSESKINSKTITDLLNKSNKEFNEIQQIKEDSKQILEEIQSIYGIAAETGLSGEFDKRRSQLKKLIVKWEERIFYTSLGLLIMIVSMFLLQLYLYDWNLKDHTFDINFYVRFLIASPVVYYLFFCSNQYNQAKKLHDKYSFKTTLAMSIKSHIELLTQNTKLSEKDRMDKILEFVIEGFHKIYSEPYSDDDYKLKVKLANIEADLEKRILETITKTMKVNDEK